jgi:uncharacterized protein (TIGR02466 family)
VNDSRFKNLKAQIIQAVDEHCRNIHCLNKFYVSALWVNINYQYNFNKLHNHTSSVFSGVYYVNVPEHSGNLVFERGDNSYMWSADSLDFNEFNCYNSQLWNIAPQENYIYLFPSNQMHRVDPNLSEEPRISISFNINRED